MESLYCGERLFEYCLRPYNKQSREGQPSRGRESACPPASGASGFTRRGFRRRKPGRGCGPTRSRRRAPEPREPSWMPTSWLPDFCCLESDCLPLGLQLAAIASFRLPVAAVLTSGGASYHAWIHLNCHDLEEYTRAATRILCRLPRFGFDAANKNPSRLVATARSGSAKSRRRATENSG